MTRRAQKRNSRLIDIIILVVVIGVLLAYGVKTFQDYLAEKEDERISAELASLLDNDLTLYEEELPDGSTDSITVLEASNEDLLLANVSYYGIVEIPRFNIRKPVVRGTTRKDIANKVGYDEHSGNPGESGNVILAAHNRINFFGRISSLRNGDEIKLTTRDGKYTYKVFKKFKVYKDETWVYNKVEGHDKVITLITCGYPDANNRWIVRGEQVSAE